MKHKIRVYVGPTAVDQFAHKFRDAGLNVTVEGTEHLHLLVEGFDSDGAAWNVGVALFRAYGHAFDWVRPEPVPRWFGAPQ